MYIRIHIQSMDSEINSEWRVLPNIYMQNKLPHNIILIDAECLLCHGFAKFVISQDTAKNMLFWALQDQELKEKIEHDSILYPDSDSVLVYTGAEILQKSRAVLYTLTQLPRYRQRSRIWYILPSRLSDSVYDFVARNRKKRFGEKENCDLTVVKKIQDRLV